MLDVLMPLPPSSLDLVPGCVEALQTHTDVPFRVIALLDGGETEDINTLHAMLGSTDVEWTMMHNRAPVYLSRCVLDAFQVMSAPLLALVPPEIRIVDGKWFGKMQRVMHVDPLCAVIDSEPSTRSTSLAPFKRTHHRLPQGSKLAMFEKVFAQSIAAINDLDPIHYLAAQAFKVGRTAWNAPGVLYHVADHKEHQRCPESLEPHQEAFESSSQKTDL